MQATKKLPVNILLILLANSVHAQVDDAYLPGINATDTSITGINWNGPEGKKGFKAKSYILPGAMITYGFIALGNTGLKDFNAEIRDEVYAEHPHNKLHLDNYLQFAPAALAYGLDVFGIKAKHKLKDRTMLFLLSNVLANASVFSLKKLSHRLRPDSSDYYSFPSGHTTEAFANAEFLFQEYKDVSPWYGIAGYSMAVATAYLRLYNNKHWLSDVVTGAGLGIISTKLAYWLYPKIQHKFFKDKPVQTLIMPSYRDGSFGLYLVRRL